MISQGENLSRTQLSSKVVTRNPASKNTSPPSSFVSWHRLWAETFGSNLPRFNRRGSSFWLSFSGNIRKQVVWNYRKKAFHANSYQFPCKYCCCKSGLFVTEGVAGGVCSSAAASSSFSFNRFFSANKHRVELIRHQRQSPFVSNIQNHSFASESLKSCSFFTLNNTFNVLSAS